MAGFSALAGFSAAAGFSALTGFAAPSPATALAIADLRLAALLAWMTPLLVALSSFLVATARAACALAVSPEATASRVVRMAV